MRSSNVRMELEVQRATDKLDYHRAFRGIKRHRRNSRQPRREVVPAYLREWQVKQELASVQ
jgi:hypothetical protein